MKDNNHNLSEQLDKRSFKKKYLVRKLQEAEAEKEIKDFDNGRETGFDGTEDTDPRGEGLSKVS